MTGIGKVNQPDIDLFLVKKKYLERAPRGQLYITIPIPVPEDQEKDKKNKDKKNKYFQFNLRAHTRHQWRKDAETGKWIHPDTPDRHRESIILVHFGKYEDDNNRPYNITQHVHHEMDWNFYQKENHFHEEYQETYIEAGDTYETEYIFAAYKGDKTTWNMERVPVDDDYQGEFCCRRP